MRRLLLALLSLAGCLIAASSNAGLIEAVKNGDTQSVRSLLAQHVDVNTAEADGSTALHWAAQRDNRQPVDRRGRER
jgi:uncharacterized protein